MNKSTQRLEQLVRAGLDYLSHASESELNEKKSPEKWSKKEVLGHLIDSGINNLQRFTEVQYESKPYTMRKYKQDELVKANDYQHSDMHELTQLWVALNTRILKIMENLTEIMLDYKIELPDGQISDLRFLVIDYVDHLEHHLKQVKAK